LYLKTQGVALQQMRSGVQDYFVGENVFMRIIEGWKKIDNERGYLNVVTGQNLIVSKKQFGQQYLVLLFPEVKNGDEGRKISPEFVTKLKAEAFAFDWMKKNPKEAKGI
jgi:hypothetical protein